MTVGRSVTGVVVCAARTVPDAAARIASCGNAVRSISACQSRPFSPAMDAAARTDGASWFQHYWRITLPPNPARDSAAIYTFTTHWYRFSEPPISLDRPTMFAPPLGLNQSAAEQYMRYAANRVGFTWALV